MELRFIKVNFQYIQFSTLSLDLLLWLKNGFVRTFEKINKLIWIKVAIIEPQQLIMLLFIITSFWTQY